MKRVKSTKEKEEAPVIVPQSREDAAQSARVINAAQLAIERLVADRDTAIAKISEGFNADIAQHGTVISARLGGIKIWAKANAALFGKKKSLDLDGTTVGFRDSAATKPLRGWTWESVLNGIQEKIASGAEELGRFLRPRVDLNREQMLSEREDAELLSSLGVRIAAKETFYLQPQRDGQAGPELTL